MSSGSRSDERDGGRRWSRALVTGASSGIGEATARQLAAEGTDLILVARSRDRLDALRAEIQERHGGEVEVMVVDLGAPVPRVSVERRLADRISPVDLLVNNAGFGTVGPFDEAPVALEEQEVQLNVLAVLRLCSAAADAMRERGKGSILNVASIAAMGPTPNMATYGATKAFVASFSESLHTELASSGVTVTVTYPGFTRTEFQARAGWGGGSTVPAGAWLSPEQVARESLDATHAGHARCVPGRAYKAAVAVAGLIPDAPRRWLQRKGQGRLG